MALVVLYDANVLNPNTLRDLLIRVAQAGLAQAKVDRPACKGLRRGRLPPAS